MKIAFDLDDLLIPTTIKFSVGSNSATFPLSLICREKLRVGAVELISNLAKSNDIYIYTTSLRSRTYITIWFFCLGIRLKRVINSSVHRSVVANTKYSKFSKAPKLFGIDMLVDDSPGVKIECIEQGVRCLIIDKYDDHWVSTVKNEIQC